MSLCEECEASRYLCQREKEDSALNADGDDNDEVLVDFRIEIKWSIVC